jgi:hypothetical protein
MTHWTDALVRMGACREAIEWSCTQPDLSTAWRECRRGDWMLWLLGKIDRSEPWSEGRKRIVRCAVECAAEAEPYEGDGDAGRAAAECRRAVLAWIRGEATCEDVVEAREAASVAAAAAASSAAYAASSACVAAGDTAASTAADAAVYAADAAANAAAADAAYAERDRVLVRCADIVRAHYPDPPAIKGGDR